MTTLETFLVLAALWLGVAWLPYILDRILVRGLTGALANYDPAAIPQSPWAQRAQRAHVVGVEAFAVFAPLALLAVLKLPEDPLPGTAAAVYFFAMVAHYVIYCFGIIVVRTLAFATAVGASLVIALRLLGVL